MVIGRARRWSSGKSTWTLSHCAWKPAKRAVMVWKRSRTASRWSNTFLRRKSARLLETSSLRRKVENFSYCHRAEGFIAQVEIVVRETAALVGEDPVIWILRQGTQAAHSQDCNRHRYSYARRSLPQFTMSDHNPMRVITKLPLS